MLLACLLLALALPMMALERRTGERGVVRITPGEIINDTGFWS
jgi:hypothetical protein